MPLNSTKSAKPSAQADQQSATNNRNVPGKTYPIIQSISGQPDLARELQALRQMVYTLQDSHQAMAQNSAPTPASSTLTADQLDQIRKALQIGGSHPLNTTGLLS